MGICNSCEAAAVAAAGPTLKLVLPDGKLQEFERPVKAAHVLPKDDVFVCSSDDMEFDCFVTAIAANEELQPGQLYFVLPNSMLRRPLLAEDMAALAVRANTALASSGSCRCPKGFVAPLTFPAGTRADASPRAAPQGQGVEERRRRRTRSRSGGRSFTSNLDAITE